jgi:hypothetical protein
MNENKIFQHDGKEFEIRVATLNGKSLVKVFLNNIQVSPEYAVDVETRHDYFAKYQESLVAQLVSIAKSDIKKGIYYKA